MLHESFEEMDELTYTDPLPPCISRRAGSPPAQPLLPNLMVSSRALRPAHRQPSDTVIVCRMVYAAIFTLSAVLAGYLHYLWHTLR